MTQNNDDPADLGAGRLHPADGGTGRCASPGSTACSPPASRGCSAAHPIWPGSTFGRIRRSPRPRWTCASGRRPAARSSCSRWSPPTDGCDPGDRTPPGTHDVLDASVARARAAVGRARGERRVAGRAGRRGGGREPANPQVLRAPRAAGRRTGPMVDTGSTRRGGHPAACHQGRAAPRIHSARSGRAVGHRCAPARQRPTPGCKPEPPPRSPKSRRRSSDLTVIRDTLRQAVDAGCDDLIACAGRAAARSRSPSSPPPVAIPARRRPPRGPASARRFRVGDRGPLEELRQTGHAEAGGAQRGPPVDHRHADHLAGHRPDERGQPGERRTTRNRPG